MADWFFNPRFPRILLGLFALYWLAWAIRPLYFQDWLLENFLLTLFIAGLILTHRRFPLSNISYTLIFVFVCLHTIGAHYTYAQVPYDDWFRALFGTGLNELLGFERNHFDRLVHFSFGFLLAYPIREIFLRVAGARGFWGYYLPLDVTMSFSMLFELFEWAAAVVFGGELGQAYLGTQGDVWDAHKDMALASLGAVISMCVVARHQSAVRPALRGRVAGEPGGEGAAARRAKVARISGGRGRIAGEPAPPACPRRWSGDSGRWLVVQHPARRALGDAVACGEARPTGLGPGGNFFRQHGRN